MKELRTTRLKTSEIVLSAIVLIAFVIGITIGSNCTFKSSTVPLQRDAIQKGFAEWVVVDPETGRTEFAWNQIDLASIKH